MRVRLLVAALVVPLGLAACATEDPSPAADAGVVEREGEPVLHQRAPCAGLRAEQALCGGDDGGLAQPPVPRRDIPGVFDDDPGGALDSP